MNKKEEKEGMEELIEEVRAIRRCLEKVMVFLRRRYTETGGESDDVKRTEESKGIIRKKEIERKGGKKERKEEAGRKGNTEREDAEDQEDREGNKEKE